MLKPKFEAEQFELRLPPRKYPGKPRYSYSAVDQAKCSMRYYHAKMDPSTRKETYNLVAGTLLDTAFNAYYENNEHLKDTHENRKDYARAACQLALDEHPDWYTMAWSKKAGDVRSSPENYLAWLFDLKAIDLVCRHDRGPVEVQVKVELDLPEYVIVGYIDCLELDTNTVVDVKSITGWSDIAEMSYALKAQVALYRMILQDSRKLETKGRYELLLCRKKPQLSIVPDFNIEFLQEKLVKDFDAHHHMLCTHKFEKNPEQCFVYNKMCPAFLKCWPELTELVQSKTKLN